MIIFVGSKNPVKINSVINATSKTWPNVKIIGFETKSGVSDQPMSNSETKIGAINRAKTALAVGLEKIKSTKGNHILSIGLEGGVFLSKNNELWSTVWVSVVDQKGNSFESNGARFKVPAIIAEKIKNGKEMGPIVSKLIKEKNVSQKQGMIGVITNNFIDRTEEYTGIVKMTIGLWYGHNWDTKL